MVRVALAVAFLMPSLLSAADAPYDVILRGGTVYDGTGAADGGRTSASAAIASPPSAT